MICCCRVSFAPCNSSGYRTQLL